MRCLKFSMYNVFCLVGKVAYLSVKVGTKNETKKSERFFLKNSYDNTVLNTSETIKRPRHLGKSLKNIFIWRHCVFGWLLCISGEMLETAVDNYQLKIYYCGFLEHYNFGQTKPSQI